MLDDIVRDQLRSEILQIEDLFAEFSELLDKSEKRHTSPSGTSSGKPTHTCCAGKRCATW